MSDAKAIEILLIEDNPQDADLAMRALQQARVANRIHVGPGSDAVGIAPKVILLLNQPPEGIEQ
jgi:predicted O-methyltransferase YrrM